MHRPVARKPRLRCKGRCVKADKEMAFAGPVIAGVAGVQVAFVHHLQQVGCESGLKAGMDFGFDGRHWCGPPSPSGSDGYTLAPDS